MNCWQTLTDMKSLEDVNSEMQKKYRDTWLKISMGDEDPIFGMFQGNNNPDSYLLKTMDKGLNWNTIEYHFDHHPLLSITVPKPEIGCYSTNKTKQLVVFNTLPHRQWKRGLCKGNSTIFNVIGNYSNGAVNDFNGCIVDVLHNTKTYTLEEAITTLNTEKSYGVAINRNFGITLNFNSTNDSFLFLFYRQYLIGKVLRNKKRIILENELFLQEVIDSRHTWCPDYEVTVND